MHARALALSDDLEESAMRYITAAILALHLVTAHSETEKPLRRISEIEGYFLGLPTSVGVLNELFGLWTECSAIQIHVYVQNGEIIDLNQERVEIALRSRLRSARLYNKDPEKSDSVLNVKILLGGEKDSNDFTYMVSFEKRLTDDITGISRLISAGWYRWVLGANRNANDILTSLAPHIDAFIDEYLRVNEHACE